MTPRKKNSTKYIAFETSNVTDHVPSKQRRCFHSYITYDISKLEMVSVLDYLIDRIHFVDGVFREPELRRFITGLSLNVHKPIKD